MTLNRRSICAPMIPARSGVAKMPEVFWENCVSGLETTNPPSLMAGTRPTRALNSPPTATTIGTSIVSCTERNSGCALLKAFVSQSAVVAPESIKKTPETTVPSCATTPAWTLGMVVPDELERQTLTRAGVRVGCRIVEMEHLVCVIDFNNIVAEYIGAEESISAPAHFTREPF